ncbi:MAG: hypothetical protein FWD61_18750 [Phycisphaerales bacterium]|nr:hypothetical protein [Phycisphaerales bacterium]
MNKALNHHVSPGISVGGIGAMGVALLLAGAGGILMLRGLGDYVLQEGSTAGAAIVFGAAMVVLSPFLWFWGRQIQRQDAFRRRHPDEPWLWNAKWAGGRIRNSDWTKVYHNYLIAAFLLAFPLTVFTHKQNTVEIRPARANRQAIVVSNNAAMYFAMGFSLAGAAYLIYAGVNTWRLVKFGASTLQLATFPGVIGGQLVGVIYTQHKVPASDGYHLRLQCIHRVITGYGRYSRVKETPVWEAENTMARGVMDEDMSRTAIPVGFRIPGYCRPSDVLPSRDRIYWQLQVLAKVPGLNYRATFVVPVFLTEDSTMEEEPAGQVDPVAAYRA